LTYWKPHYVNLKLFLYSDIRGNSWDRTRGCSNTKATVLTRYCGCISVNVMANKKSQLLKYRVHESA
jgi:hypothetical protein